MDKFYQELFGVLTRARPMSRQSKAASLQQHRKRKRNDNDMQKGISRPSRQQVCECDQTGSKEVNGSIIQTSGINPAQLIHNFITR